MVHVCLVQAVSVEDFETADGVLTAAKVQDQQQQQVQAKQALRDRQHGKMVSPPDAAVNFSPAVGRPAVHAHTVVA